MGLTVKSQGSSNMEPIPAGTHQAVCYAVIDLGTHHDDKFNKDNQKLMLMWEIPSETIKIDGIDKPRAISKEYTANLCEKSNLTKDLISWRGKPFTDTELAGFQMKNLIGANCILTVIHKKTAQGSVYAVIAGISGLMKGMAKIKPTNPETIYDMEISMDIPTTIPEWIQKKIKESKEYLRSGGKEEAPEYDDSFVPTEEADMAVGEDEIPF